MTQSDFRDDERSVTLNQLFEALSSPVRRRILMSLRSQSPRKVDEFQSEEFRPANTGPTSFKIRLDHKYLPYLDDAGFINWNRESNTIMRGPDFVEIQPLMTCIQNQFDDYFEN